MITFSRFGKHGRFGNQLFQLASLIGFKNKYGCDLILPPWEYSKYFKGSIPQTIVPSGRLKEPLKEPYYHYTPEFWDNHADSFKSKTVDILGWLQTEKYWEHCVEEVKSTLSLRDDFKDTISNRFSEALSRPNIAISVRRGDYVDNPNYDLLPIDYYLKALIKHFDTTKYNLIIFSDDFKYCKTHFECFDNVYFAEGSGIEQLCLMSLCDNYIISNSTFSWWGAYLGEKPGSKIIRPTYLFAGPLLAKSDAKDHYPDRWIAFDHKAQPKFDLKDVTFTIPVSYDHPDRYQNLSLNVCMLQRYFHTNIIIAEQGGNKFKNFEQWCEYIQLKDKNFHRTRMLNEMAIQAKTDIIVNWDADVFVPPAQIIQAVSEIRRNKADMVYPYDGRFARVPRAQFSKLENYLDVGVLQDDYKGTHSEDLKSVGGAIFFRKDSFIAGGMENQNFISYGPEDVERYERFTRLGFKVHRVNGVLFHIDHYRGKNSTIQHQYAKNNEKHLERQRRMTEEQLRIDVTGWSWAHAYTEEYYETITENAIRSRDAVFEVLLREFKFMSFVKTVIDVGCGLGEWGHELESKLGMNYIGIDHKIPVNKLLIDRSSYIDFDLRQDHLGITNQVCDLCVCLEVLEHLPEEVAELNIERLTKFSDYILFSAAIPNQGGRNHINEQWQTYWEKLFNKFGFYASEKPLVNLLKDNKNVDVWYRQNIVLYSNKFEGKAFDYVDPEMYTNVVKSLSR
jgi:2-polyprenyl-3-methyl-5-hydroxy-6-metoxy-1,4-benzoquinol methylase